MKSMPNNYDKERQQEPVLRLRCSGVRLGNVNPPGKLRTQFE